MEVAWADVQPSDLLGSTGLSRDDLDGTTAPGSAPSPARLRSILLASDVANSALAWLFALAVARIASGVEWLFLVVTGVLSLLVLSRSRGLYLARVSSVRSLELAELLRVCLWSSAIGTAIAWLVTYQPSPLSLVALAVVVFVGQFVLVAVGRSVFDDWLKQHRVRGVHCRRVVLVGYDDSLAALCSTLRDHPETGYRVVGCFGPAGDEPASDRPEWLGSYSDVAAWSATDGASGAIVSIAALASTDGSLAVRALLDSRVHVQLSPGLAGIDYRRLRALPLAHEPLLYVEHRHPTVHRDQIKRALDLLIAPALLLAASPVLLLAMAAVRLSGGGPVFYSQERVGRHGRVFKMWKLRTMVVGADRMLGELEGQNARSGPLFKVPTDPRVTPVGRVLRVLSLDELPQLFNVVMGQMTLVGPRPALASEVLSFDHDLLRRHDVVPGITGLWQVEARDNPSFGAYRRLDLFYVDNWSVSLDLVILVLTAHVVLIRAARSFARRFSRTTASGSLLPATGTLD